MARYGFEANRTSSLTLAVASVVCDTGTPRRGKLYELVFGSEAAPVDAALLWQVNRCTTAGTSTGVTPNALDPADAVALSDCGENHTVTPTLTAGAIPLSVPLNSRATFRWVAAPGSELVFPATAANGFAIETPTSTSLIAVTCTLFFEEQ